MSTMKYNGGTVMCCCANCRNSMGGDKWEETCALSGEPHHRTYECGSYEFSEEKFNGTEAAPRGGGDD